MLTCVHGSAFQNEKLLKMLAYTGDSMRGNETMED